MQEIKHCPEPGCGVAIKSNRKRCHTCSTIARKLYRKEAAKRYREKHHEIKTRLCVDGCGEVIPINSGRKRCEPCRAAYKIEYAARYRKNKKKAKANLEPKTAPCLGKCGKDIIIANGRKRCPECAEAHKKQIVKNNNKRISKEKKENKVVQSAKSKAKLEADRIAFRKWKDGEDWNKIILVEKSMESDPVVFEDRDAEYKRQLCLSLGVSSL